MCGFRELQGLDSRTAISSLGSERRATFSERASWRARFCSWSQHWSLGPSETASLLVSDDIRVSRVFGPATIQDKIWALKQASMSAVSEQLWAVSGDVSGTITLRTQFPKRCTFQNFVTSAVAFSSGSVLVHKVDSLDAHIAQLACCFYALELVGK